MKNVSSEYSTKRNMRASVCIAATQAGPNQGQINGHIKTETNDSMIFCNNELANSFQVLKERTGSIGHPGHYIQKALNNVTTNSRSQSLPSCLETKKSIVPSCKPEVKSVQIPVKLNKESWFRTWPERGNDKLNLIITPNNNTDVSNICRPSADCDSITDTRGSSNNNNSSAESSPKHAIPLSELLENIPLAYSPLTRQLHIICRAKPPETPAKSEPESENDSCSDLLRPLESIEEDLNENAESPRSTLQRTDASSFSSIVSSLSDISPSTTEEELQGSRGRDSRSSGESCSLFEDAGAKPKRRGISGFFSRSVFAWKSQSSEEPSSQPSSQPGWRLFGSKAAPVHPEDEPASLGDSPCSIRSDRTCGDASALIKDTRLGACDSPCSVRSDRSGGGKKYEDVVASSSALILHQRPANLPAKSQGEDAKHRHEYQLMVEAAKKKETREAKCRKKQLQQQLKLEEQQAVAARVWNLEILPKWDTMCGSRKARDLWWRGLPPSVRGKVWLQAIGNPLNITRQLYDICVSRARDHLRAGVAQEDAHASDADKESSVQLIQLDIARTFPHLCIFQEGGPCYDMLHCLLGAYACYRPDVGYVQGMSFIAAVLILNLDVADAFVCFANLLNRPCLMAFFRLNQTSMQAYYATYDAFFLENLPRLHRHFSSSSLTPDLYLLDWLYTVFAKAMPLDVASRVWDVFLRDGEQFLFRAALGVLHHKQEALLRLDFLHGAQFLTRLPDDLSADELFRSVDAIKMVVGGAGFEEVLARHVAACQEGVS